MAFDIPELVYAFDPGGPEEDYPEQPEAYNHPVHGATVLVPGYTQGVYILDPATWTELDVWPLTQGSSGAIHADGTYLQWTQKFNADGTVYDANYLQSSDPDSSWGDVLQPFDLAVDDTGRIWGTSDQRAIWCWNADGTIYRHFNEFSPVGGSIPARTRAITWHDGLLYLGSSDGIWVTDPYDPGSVTDDLAPRTDPNDIARPDGYALHFTRLVDIDTDDSGPADTGHAIATYQGGIAVHGGRVYFVDVGDRLWTSPVDARILSCSTAGVDQTPVVEYVPDTFENGAANYGLSGLQVIDGYLYASGLWTSRLYRWPLEVPGCTLEVGSRVLCVPFAGGNDYAIALNCPEAAADLSVGQRVLCTPIHGGNDYAIQS